jgi:Fe-S-cluster-containing dehydrogenase component
MGCGLCAWACPYGAREMDQQAGVMKKCTLCVDRIYNENIPEQDRVPACVRTCPANARHFGDLADPESDVSKMVAERGGIDLMPEQGTKPVNKYLPPRIKDTPPADLSTEPFSLASMAERRPDGFLGWLDRALARLN